MSQANIKRLVGVLTVQTLAVALIGSAKAGDSSFTFTTGDLVVAVEGNGVEDATSGPYADNQAAPLTLFEYQPDGTGAPATYEGSLVLPQTASGTNFPVSGEYGSSSEGTLQLTGNGKYLTIMGYGVNAASFNADPAKYSSTGNPALRQSGSLTGQTYTAVPRVVAVIGQNGSVNSTTALYNIFDQNKSAQRLQRRREIVLCVGPGQLSGCDRRRFLCDARKPLGDFDHRPGRGGNGKQTSASSAIGDGGLQKWTFNGTNWTLDYTLADGLDLVENNTADPSNTSGTTGLYGLTGEDVTVDGVQEVEFFATNATIGDTDQTYLYGITDVLADLTNPGDESFTMLAKAPADSNFKGVAFAPSPVPEASTWAMMLAGFAGLGLAGLRRCRAATSAS
jgi:hypothetical protein